MFSALPLRADIHRHDGDVRLVPTADIWVLTTSRRASPNPIKSNTQKFGAEECLLQAGIAQTKFEALCRGLVRRRVEALSHRHRELRIDVQGRCELTFRRIGLVDQTVETCQPETTAEIFRIESDGLAQYFNRFGIATQLFESVGEDTAIIGGVEWIELHCHARRLLAASLFTGKD